MGFNHTLFASADALLFKPLPVPNPDTLVDVFTNDSTGTQQFSTSSYPDYLDLKAGNDVFEDLIGYSPMFGAMNRETSSRLAMGEIVTGNYFRVLGVKAAIGRTILPEDDVPGAPRVAMVSDGYWKRELGGSTNLDGRTLRIRGNTFSIVGVAPASFTGMVPILAPELWVPVASSLEVEPVGIHDVIAASIGTTRLDRRGDRWMFIRGRLNPGKTIDQARANLELLVSRLAETYPQTNKGRRVLLKATSDVHVHPAADPTVVPIAAGLMVIVGLVLLIACANVASMLLARASGRQKEIGIRLALGASRMRLVRQLVTESLVMASLGAAAGILLAWWATSALAAIQLPLTIPLTFGLRLDGRVLLFTVVATLLAGLIAGLAPALQASKTSLVADLRGEAIGPRVGPGR